MFRLCDTATISERSAAV